MAGSVFGPSQSQYCAGRVFQTKSPEPRDDSRRTRLLRMYTSASLLHSSEAETFRLCPIASQSFYRPLSTHHLVSMRMRLAKGYALIPALIVSGAMR